MELNTLYQNEKDRFNSFKYKLEEIKDEDEDLYYRIQDIVGSLSDDEIESLSEEERQCYELFTWSDEAYENMNEIWNQIMTPENELRIDNLVPIDESLDKDALLNELSYVEKKYYKIGIDKHLRINRKAISDLKENWTPEEEYDEDDNVFRTI